MNFYELVVDGLEKLRLEIQAEKEHRANVEKKIRLIENRTIYTLWILALMCVFLCLNIAHQIRTEGPKIDDAPISVHFNFNLDDSWANSLLQQMKTIYVEQRERFTAWDVTWRVDGVIEKASMREIFNLTISPIHSTSSKETAYDVQVIIFDKRGSSLLIEGAVVSIPTSSDTSEYRTLTSMSLANTFENIHKSLDVLELRRSDAINDSIGVTLHIRKSRS